MELYVGRLLKKYMKPMPTLYMSFGHITTKRSQLPPSEIVLEHIKSHVDSGLLLAEFQQYVYICMYVCMYGGRDAGSAGSGHLRVVSTAVASTPEAVTLGVTSGDGW